jgi:hypothetical protein
MQRIWWRFGESSLECGNIDFGFSSPACPRDPQTPHRTPAEPPNPMSVRTLPSSPSPMGLLRLLSPTDLISTSARVAPARRCSPRLDLGHGRLQLRLRLQEGRGREG